MATLQSFIVALLVPGCTAYAVWKLMPAAARRSMAVSVLRIPSLPRRMASALRKAANAGSGCACDGCDHAQKQPAATAPAQRAIQFHPRVRR